MLLFLAGSCAPEPEMATEDPYQPAVALKDGLMYFKDAETLHAELGNLANMDSADYAAWKAQWQGFRSLQDRYDAIAEEVLKAEDMDEVDIEQLVKREGLPYYEGLSYAKVVSGEGILLVGEDMLVLREDKEFSMSFDRQNLALARTAKTLAELNDASARVHTVYDQLEDKRRKWTGSSLEKITPYPNQTNNLSAHLEAWSLNFTYHVEVGASITGRKYKKRCGTCRRKWQNDDMWYAKVQGTFRAYNSQTQRVEDYNIFRERNHHDYVADSEPLPPGSYLIEQVTAFERAYLFLAYHYEDDGYPRLIWQREF